MDEFGMEIDLRTPFGRQLLAAFEKFNNVELNTKMRSVDGRVFYLLRDIAPGISMVLRNFNNALHEERRRSHWHPEFDKIMRETRDMRCLLIELTGGEFIFRWSEQPLTFDYIIGDELDIREVDERLEIFDRLGTASHWPSAR